MNSYQKRKKGNFYNAQKARKRREFVLKPGLRGFLCTCNNREKDCIRESYNILNEYADKLYGEEKKETSSVSSSTASAVADPDPSTAEAGSEDDEIETALNKEIETLKAEHKKLPSKRRFQVVESGANNCIFIQTTVPEPVELVHHLMKDLEATKQQKTRFLLRLLPIEATCKAYLEDIRQTADLLFEKYFSKEGKTFAVLFNRRNSSGLNREDLIRVLAEMVLTRHPENKADLKHPQLAIIVEVIRNMCCLAVIPDYFELRKYNLLELCSPEGGIKLVDKNDTMVSEKGDGDTGVEEDDDDDVEETEVLKSKESDTVTDLQIDSKKGKQDDKAADENAVIELKEDTKDFKEMGDASSSEIKEKSDISSTENKEIKGTATETDI